MISPITAQEHLALKSSVHVMNLGDSTFIGDGRAEIVLPGAALFPVIDKLCAALNGARSREAIAEGLPTQVRPLFDNLVGALDRHGMLQRLAPSAVDPAYPAGHPYRDVLLFLRDREFDFAAQFERWRQTRLALVGSGYVLKAAARAFACLGIERICLHVEAGDVTPDEVVSGVADHFESVGRGEIEVVDRARFEREVRGSDMLIHAGDRLRPERGLAGTGDVAAVRLALIAGVVDGVGLVVPLRGDADIDALRSRLRGRRAPPPSIASSALIGSVAAFRALSLSSVSARRLGDGPALPLLKVGSGGHVTEHLLCRTSACSPATISALAETAVARRAALAERIPEAEDRFEPLFDSVVGPFSWVAPGTQDQIPLAHESIELTVPDGAADVVERVTGRGRDRKDARADALRRAAVRYAEIVEDRQPGDVRAPIVAAADYAVWRQNALAYALVASPGFERGLQAWAVDPESAADLEVPWYARMAATYGRTPVKTWIGQSTACPGVLAYAQAGAAETWGAAATHQEALSNALGDLCSEVVRGEPWASPSATLLELARQLSERAAGDPMALSELPPVPALESTGGGSDELFAGDAILALAGLWAGRVSLERTGETGLAEHGP